MKTDWVQNHSTIWAVSPQQSDPASLLPSLTERLDTYACGHARGHTHTHVRSFPTHCASHLYRTLELPTRTNCMPGAPSPGTLQFQKVFVWSDLSQTQKHIVSYHVCTESKGKSGVTGWGAVRNKEKEEMHRCIKGCTSASRL